MPIFYFQCNFKSPSSPTFMSKTTLSTHSFSLSGSAISAKMFGNDGPSNQWTSNSRHSFSSHAHLEIKPWCSSASSVCFHIANIQLTRLICCTSDQQVGSNNKSWLFFLEPVCNRLMDTTITNTLLYLGLLWILHMNALISCTV